MVLKVLFTTIIVNLFLRMDSNITGLRFLTGPLGLPGLGKGINCPKLSSKGSSSSSLNKLGDSDLSMISSWRWCCDAGRV